MSKMLKMALIASLEEMNPDTEYEAQVNDPELVIPEGAYPQDEEGPSSIIEVVDQMEEAEELVESLEAIARMADEFIKNGTASASTAALIQVSVESLLSPYELTLPFAHASMESLESDYVQFHKASCEGISEFVTRLKENIKNGWKSFKDDFMYVLKTRNEKLIQLDRRLREVKSFVSKRKEDLKKSEYRINYGALVKMFRINDEVVTDFSKAIESDKNFVDEALGNYQNSIVKAMTEFATAISGSSGVHDAVERVSKIKHPARHTSQTLTSGTPMMGNWGLRFKEGKRIKGVMLGELGFNSYLNLYYPTSRIFKDIGMAILFGENANAFEGSMNGAYMSPESLTKGIDSLDTYVKMIRNSISNSHKAIDAADKIWGSFEKLKAEEGSSNELKALETAARWLIANSDRPFDGVVDHGFFVMGTLISFVEHLGRRLK
jgi:hypothetical protein